MHLAHGYSIVLFILCCNAPTQDIIKGIIDDESGSLTLEYQQWDISDIVSICTIDIGQELILLFPNGSHKQFRYNGNNEWISNNLLSESDTSTQFIISSIWSNAQYFGSIHLQIDDGDKIMIIYNALYCDDDDGVPQMFEQLQFLDQDQSGKDIVDYSSETAGVYMIQFVCMYILH